MLFPRFDVIRALSQHTRAAKWNLFVKSNEIWVEDLAQRATHQYIICLFSFSQSGAQTSLLQLKACRPYSSYYRSKTNTNRRTPDSSVSTAPGWQIQHRTCASFMATWWQTRINAWACINRLISIRIALHTRGQINSSVLLLVQVRWLSSQCRKVPTFNFRPASAVE